jgi:hypothetical protein
MGTMGKILGNNGHSPKTKTWQSANYLIKCKAAGAGLKAQVAV